MAPYDPPVAHYTQLDVSQYTDEQMLAAIGKDGHGFYRLTERLSLNYLWWDNDRKVVELWGSFGSLQRGAVNKLSAIFNNRFSNVQSA